MLLIKSVVLVLWISTHIHVAAQSWFPPDAFDAIRDQMEFVDADNCPFLSPSVTQLQPGTLTHRPRYSTSNQTRHDNRTVLWEVHTMALSKGIAYSFIASKLNESYDHQHQAGLMHHYMATVADVETFRGHVTGSGIFYDTHTMYSNWYNSLPFNTTLPLFGPKAIDLGAYNQSLYDGEVEVTDYGAGPDQNYTSDDHSPWYNLYLPDPEENEALDPLRKDYFDILLKYANSTDYQTSVMVYAKLALGEPNEYEPVEFTPPYFDCGRTNRWIVSAAAPLVDFLPRYLDWLHLRRNTFTAASVIDVDFELIDINQCPLGVGNPAPNDFSATARCKYETTTCSPLSGFGLSRGGYECCCKPGLVYPPLQTGPFRGIDIENSTQEGYENGFDCITELQYKEMTASIELPTSDADSVKAQSGSKKFLPRYHRQNPADEPKFDLKARLRVDKLLHDYLSNQHLVEWPQETAYGVEEQFSSQAKLAVRLANFLSNFLQNMELTPAPEDPQEDRPFHRDLLVGEVLGLVLADLTLVGSGIFFDQDMYMDWDLVIHEFYGPYAFRETLSTCTYSRAAPGDIKVRDRTDDSMPYYTQQWFLDAKDRWSLPDGLAHYQQYPDIRSDITGTGLTQFRRYPMSYHAAVELDGSWTSPYCPCDGEVNINVVTYSVPFFAPIEAGQPEIQFAGVVTVDVPLDSVDINQCFQPFWAPNAFKNSAMCDYVTTNCEPMKGAGFRLGSYQCVCKPGYKYPQHQRGPFTAAQVEGLYMDSRDGLASCVPMCCEMAPHSPG